MDLTSPTTLLSTKANITVPAARAIWRLADGGSVLEAVFIFSIRVIINAYHGSAPFHLLFRFLNLRHTHCMIVRVKQIYASPPQP